MYCQNSRRIQFSFICENCLQKQNSYIINKFENICHLDFTLFCLDNIVKRHKFRRVKFESYDDAYLFYSCKECSNYLNPNINYKEANLSKNTWPPFIYTVLSNREVINLYADKVWQSISHQWQYRWIDTIPFDFEEAIQ